MSSSPRPPYLRRNARGPCFSSGMTIPPLRVLAPAPASPASTSTTLRPRRASPAASPRSSRRRPRPRRPTPARPVPTRCDRARARPRRRARAAARRTPERRAGSTVRARGDRRHVIDGSGALVTTGSVSGDRSDHDFLASPAARTGILRGWPTPRSRWPSTTSTRHHRAAAAGRPAPVHEVGAEVGLSEAAVRQRVQRLVEAGSCRSSP